MIKLLAAVGVAALTYVFVSHASAATPQTPIEHPVAGAHAGAGHASSPHGFKGLVVVEHGVVAPRDAHTGLAVGKRQHKPLLTTSQRLYKPKTLVNISGGHHKNRDPQSGLPTGQRMHKPIVVKPYVTSMSWGHHGTK